MANAPQLNQSKGKRSEEIWHYDLAKTLCGSGQDYSSGKSRACILDRAGMENDVTC